MCDYISVLCNRRYRKRDWCLCCVVVALLIGYLAYGYLVVLLHQLSTSNFKLLEFPQPENISPIKPNSIMNVVHLDLKGAAPRMRYLIDLVGRLSRTGVTGLLVEYEDMFPYEGVLKNIACKTPYTKDEIAQFLYYCALHNIEVIPLVQTFGHLEHVLKLDDFRVLREDPADARAICPSDPRSLILIKEMITQVVSAHSSIKWIHIGCDEVYTLNECYRCTRKHRSRMGTFLNHVNTVATFIRERYNHTVTPLMWDDMLRWTDADEIKRWNIPNLVDVVIWDYTPKLEPLIRGQIWDKYTYLFKRIWVAGAYKGADGEKAILPLMKTRFENHKSWMQFIRQKALLKNIVGFVSTGWSRYSHFASLCELLPASIPSLMLNSLKTSATLGFPADYRYEYNSMFKCSPDSEHRVEKQFTIDLIFNLTHVKECTFPEGRIIVTTWKLEQLQKKIKTMYEDILENCAYISDYHIANDMLSAKEVSTRFEKYAYNATYEQFFQVYTILNLELKLFYNQNTINEWIETHMQPYAKKLMVMKTVLEKAVTMSVWPRRDP